MSLILEALRKSEAERRRGQAPQLFDTPAPTTTSAPIAARLAWWWAIPALLAVALAVLWWRTAAAPDPAAPTQAMEDVAAARAVTPNDVPARTGLPGDGVATGTQQLPTDAVQAQVVVVDAPVAPDAPSLPTVAPPPRAAGATVTSPPAPTPLPAPIPGPRRQDPPVPAIATAPPPVPPPAPAMSNAPASNAPMRLADLTATERGALPPLRMSMHMWRPDPAGRFVILDGTRVGEGDLVGSAVVEEITPDGAVLNWQGRRLKVPVR